ncbi:MAG: aspartate ammonia-lyase, partial [Deltaproteobacteria bacterium]|nr:aspartate ammonia-lyase [Deltaproteobacteria bacterium]
MARATRSHPRPLRRERDSLGTVMVPRDAYYGAQTARAVSNFPISGLRAHTELIRAYARVKLAAAEVNRQLGLLPAGIARKIGRAAREVIDGRHDDQFVVDVFQAGAGTSFHMNVNEVIANRAAELLKLPRGDYARIHPNDHVNLGQSTNDTFPTAMRMASRSLLEALLGEIDLLALSLRRKGREFDRVLKSGRTHLQDAVPVRLGQEFTAYGEAVARAGRMLRRAAGELEELPIGGTATGTGLNADPRYRARVVAALSALTGFRFRSCADLREGMQSQQAMAHLSGALRNLALELGRIANDLRLLSSGPFTGLSEIRLPPVQPGSSIMPGKVNPVMAEMLNMVCFQVMGNDLTMAMAVQAGQLELNVMMPIMAHSALQSMEILKNGCREFRLRCVDGIEADAETCLEYAMRSAGLAAALNPAIGYAAAAEVAREAAATGRSIAEVVRVRGILKEETLLQVLDPLGMTEPGIPGRRKMGAKGAARRKRRT